MRKLLTGACLMAAALIAAALFLTIPAKSQTGYTVLWSQWLQNSLIDSTPIGSTTPSTGAFTSLNATSLTLNGAATANQSICGNGTTYGACGTDVYFNITGCALGTPYNGDGACSNSGSLPITAPDTTYSVTCNADYSSTSGTSYIGISVSTAPLTTTTFTYTEGATYGNGASASDLPTPLLQCHYHHN